VNARDDDGATGFAINPAAPRAHAGLSLAIAAPAQFFASSRAPRGISAKRWARGSPSAGGIASAREAMSAKCSTELTLPESGLAHKDEQFIHEQNWQKT
jgi:hypothetical protein